MFTRLLVIFTLLLTSMVGLPIAPVAASEVNDEAQFVELINELRTSKGLAPLQVHQELIGPSRQWSQRLSDNGALSHAPDLSVGVSVYWTKLGENVGVSSQEQVSELFEAFVQSPTHYKNLVDPAFAYVGVGVVYDDQGRLWTTHRFMALGQAPTPPTSASPTPTAPPTTAPPTTSAPPTTVAPQPTTDLPPTTEPAPAQLAAPLDEDAVVAIVEALSDLGI